MKTLRPTLMKLMTSTGVVTKSFQDSILFEFNGLGT